MLLKFNHKCLSVATRAAIDRPIDLAISLVALRDKSVAVRKLRPDQYLHPHRDLLIIQPGKLAVETWCVNMLLPDQLLNKPFPPVLM